MNSLTSVQATVFGHVQGVFFRAFVSNIASKLGLTGYVRNLPSGTVEVYAEGELKMLEQLISEIKIGPPGARVERIATKWLNYTGSFTHFNIRY